MNIHEYQAKQLLREYGVAVPRGGVAFTVEETATQAQELGGPIYVVKSQIHTGGRGAGRFKNNPDGKGGVRIVKSVEEVRESVREMLGQVLVTKQTGPAGKEVKRVYIEEGCDIARELYLGMLLDRETSRLTMMASAEGGMEIEELAETDPGAIVRVMIEPAVGLQGFQARGAAFACGLDSSLISQAENLLLGAYRAFRDMDATMLEINPLVVTEEGRLLALDAKMSFDDNALFRHQDVSELRDKSQEDPREMNAADRGLSYVGLEGNIGCIINGAGLAMATMDMIQLAGGEPANFLDIGGGASPDRVAKAFKLVLSDDRVEAILVNIFAGINRCDWVAEGVVKAMTELDVKVPVVVRLAGTNVEEGRRILAESDVDLIMAETLAEAGERAVSAVSWEAN